MNNLRTRTAALAVAIYLAPLYTVAELVHAVRGEEWHRIERHLDRTDDRLTVALATCLTAGDRGFVNWVADATERYTDAVCAVTARCTREPGR
ncbi:hypothetical protein ACFVXW_27105 [Streptomyces sp. NPDC058251]|uniref:hypothetical protein n=1 Tax=Streptomyces sp. NPDC058251 TaxID=3346404 RepID=UPI0036ED0D6B